jgi:uncharacterized protein DUF4178
MLAVCPHCSSLVARGDRKLEDLGKVAALVETDSPLALDVTGRFQGTPFRIVGRVQYRHQLGGVWDEWLAAFDDGRWGWLAQAQGRFYLTFRRKLAKDVVIPPYEDLELGQRFTIPAFARLVISEIGEADFVSAQGEIPFVVTPGEKLRYADLSAGGGKFATLDYSEERPLVFVGEELTLSELGIEVGPREEEPRQIAAIHVACPKCGGSLDLRAPDETQRVVCPFCNSLLDVKEGNLEYLKSLDAVKYQPVIPLGAVGHIQDSDYTVIGFMRRSVKYDITYYWQEYLLYHPRRGFRWLVHSDNHWSLVRPVPPGEIKQERADRPRFEDRTFRLFADGNSTVVQVLGEFYWKVEVGENVHFQDFIRPPQILSREESYYYTGSEKPTKGKRDLPSVTGEINWSLGTYLTVDEIERAFKLKDLKRPTTIGPNQPFRHRRIYWAWGALVLVALLAGAIFFGTGARQTVYDQLHTVVPVASSMETRVIFDGPLEITANRNIHVTVEADVINSWVYVDGDLFNEEPEGPGLVQGFALPVEYYSGIEGGESWSEGSRVNDVYLSALPEGKYTLRMEVQWEKYSQPQSIRVTIVQDDPRLLNLILLLILISIVPFCVMVWHLFFEMRRWQDSDYNPYADWSSWGGDDD